MKTVLLAVLLLLSTAAYAQLPAGSWFESSAAVLNAGKMVVDHSSNLYSVGRFGITKYSANGTALWSIPLGVADAELAVSGNDSAFCLVGQHASGVGRLMSYNAGGVAQWPRQLTACAVRSAFCVAFDHQRGRVYASGTFLNTLLLHQTTAAGGTGWVVQGTGTGTLTGQAVAVEAGTGNIYVAGTVRGSVQLGTVALAAPGATTNGFVACITPQGGVAWAQSVGGPDDDDISHLRTGAAGNVCVAGHFGSSGIFGSGPAGTLTSAGGFPNTFVASYSAQGTLRWAERAYGATSTIIAGFDNTNAGPLALSIAPRTQTYTYGATYSTLGSRRPAPNTAGA